MNPLDERDIQRLKAAAEWSRDKLKPFRENRLQALQEYVGAHYSDTGARERVPVNLIELAVNIYARQLVAARPQALITTRHRELRPFAGYFEATVNDAIVEVNLEQTLRQAVMNALFSMAVVKVGISSGNSVSVDGEDREAGRLYADCIGLDDWVHDMTARSRDGWQFCGNRWSMRLDLAKDEPSFDAAARAKLTESHPNQLQDRGETRASSISRGDSDVHSESEFRPRVELWDYWLPEDRLLVTVSNEIETPLRIIEDDGPANGPYHFLGFSDVPDSLMPLPPVAIMRDIAELANRLFRKLGRQADRQKTVVGVQGDQGQKDGENIVEANDGEVIKLLNPNNAKEYRFGGVDPPSLAFLIQLKDLFGYLNGNLDALGGLSPQSRTLGQDELLTASASQRIADMQDRVLSFTTGIIKDFAWWTWTDPVREQLVVRRMEGTDYETTFEWTPDTRQGTFLQYNFAVLPYSMAHATPASKLQGITNYIERLVIPLMPMLEMQGKTIDINALNSTIARLGNLPELDAIVTDWAIPPINDQAPAQGDSQPKIAPVTKRTYERVNRPGGTRAGQDAVTTRALMGVASQPEEMNAVGKGVG